MSTIEEAQQSRILKGVKNLVVVLYCSEQRTRRSQIVIVSPLWRRKICLQTFD